MIDDLSFLNNFGDEPSGKSDADSNPPTQDPLDFMGQPEQITVVADPDPEGQDAPVPVPLPEPAAAAPRTTREHQAHITTLMAEKSAAWLLFDQARGRSLAQYLKCIDEHGKDTADRLEPLEPDSAYDLLEKNHAESVVRFTAASKELEAFLANDCIAPPETDEQQAARRLAGYLRPPRAAAVAVVDDDGKGGKGGGGGGAGGASAPPPPPPRA